MYPGGSGITPYEGYGSGEGVRPALLRLPEL